MESNRRVIGTRIIILLLTGSLIVLSGYGCDFFNGSGGCGEDNGNDEVTNTETDTETDSPTDATTDTNTDSPDNATEDIDGNVFYVDPVNGDMNNDGSAARPFRTLQEVFENNLIETRSYSNLPYDGSNELTDKNAGAPIKAGDTLILRNGHHGEIFLRGAYNSTPITIRAEEGNAPTVSRIFLSAASNWVIRGLTITPEAAEVYQTAPLFQVESHSYHGPSSHVTIEDCHLYSVADSTSWSQADWNDLACNAIQMSGDFMTARNNDCLNVNFGITISGNNGVVSGNTVENFAGDGLRGLGDDLLFENNLVKNCYDVNENHDDGFQSWSINDDPPRQRVTLRGNTIINYEDPNQPFRGTLQGIGCFDGPYIDWVVENNLVVTDHWHGISLYGAFNSRIVNNTVVDVNGESPGPPWIMIHEHKDGTPSENCVIRNNIAATISPSGNTQTDHNYLLQENDAVFVDQAHLDFHLRPDATALIDAGSALLAPATDQDGRERPQGQGIDLGCFERD